jgi:hypothetical protein
MGTMASGVEVIGPGAKMGTPLAYPPDSSVGSGAATLDNQHVLVAGGTTPAGKDAGVRVLDLGCSTQCMSAAWGPGFPAALSFAQAFGIDAANALVVGSEPSGTTHVYRVTSAGATEVALKIPRNNARAVLSPLGTVVVVGGGSNVVESFIPQ